MFISIGASGLVYPVTGFVAVAKHVEAKTIELNLDASQNSSLFALSINGLASEAVPEYIAENLL